MQRVLKTLCLAIVIATISESVAYANYQKAQAFFARRQYAQAAAEFFQAYGYARSRPERFKAEWGLAQSLHQLGFLYSASKYYSIIVRRGPRSQNTFFRQALEGLGKIDSTLSLGQSHIVQLFKARIDPAYVPSAARGFYFYYLGVESFARDRYEKAQSYFKRVPSSSPYYIKSQFHLGVISNLRGNHSRAISYFEQVRGAAGRGRRGGWIREQANLNMARVFYETKQYRKAITNYAQIPRESDNWLQAIFEGSWAFFMLQKHNHTLGNIHTLHSPFFEYRFFPESYILQAITFLRLCRYDEVKFSMQGFKGRYAPVFKDVQSMLGNYDRDYRGFFRLIYDYRVGALNKYQRAWSILDALSRTDVYKEAGNTIRFSDREINALNRFGGSWQSSGLLDELRGFLSNKKAAAVKSAGRRLFVEASGFYAYLKELSDQTKLINAEMVLGRVDAMRARLKIGTADKKAKFIGGMQTLQVGQDLEYWPFEGEYWEDELGGYVYNIGDTCGGGKKK